MCSFFFRKKSEYKTNIYYIQLSKITFLICQFVCLYSSRLRRSLWTFSWGVIDQCRWIYKFHDVSFVWLLVEPSASKQNRPAFHSLKWSVVTVDFPRRPFYSWESYFSKLIYNFIFVINIYIKNTFNFYHIDNERSLFFTLGSFL